MEFFTLPAILTKADTKITPVILVECLAAIWLPKLHSYNHKNKNIFRQFHFAGQFLHCTLRAQMISLFLQGALDTCFPFILLHLSPSLSSTQEKQDFWPH